MLLAAQQVTQESTPLPDGHGEHSETKIEDIHGATVVETPSMARRGWQRHLT